MGLCCPGGVVEVGEGGGPLSPLSQYDPSHNVSFAMSGSQQHKLEFERYCAGDSGEEVVDRGCGEKRMRWHFDGRDFHWACLDHDEWIPVLGHADFKAVLAAMQERHFNDGRKWNDLGLEMKQGRRVQYWWRPSPAAPQGVNEFRVECDIEDTAPVHLFDLLNEHVYRAAWDTNMERGYNISRFTCNNDIGYYEAKAPVRLLSNRDFCNSRGWAALGGDCYIIANRSQKHPLVPVRRGVVRAWSYISAYYMQPCKRGGPGSTLVYFTCCDFGGNLPKSLVDRALKFSVPDACIKLARAARGLGGWREEVWRKSGQGRSRLPGPWDRTCVPNFPHIPNVLADGYMPLPPDAPKTWRVSEMSLERFPREVRALCMHERAERDSVTHAGFLALFQIAEQFDATDLMTPALSGSNSPHSLSGSSPSRPGSAVAMIAVNEALRQTRARRSPKPAPP